MTQQTANKLMAAALDTTDPWKLREYLRWACDASVALDTLISEQVEFMRRTSAKEAEAITKD